jgi:hypothetical protein
MDDLDSLQEGLATLTDKARYLDGHHASCVKMKEDLEKAANSGSRHLALIALKKLQPSAISLGDCSVMLKMIHEYTEVASRATVDEEEKGTLEEFTSIVVLVHTFIEAVKRSKEASTRDGTKFAKRTICSRAEADEDLEKMQQTLHLEENLEENAGLLSLQSIEVFAGLGPSYKQVLNELVRSLERINTPNALRWALRVAGKVLALSPNGDAYATMGNLHRKLADKAKKDEEQIRYHMDLAKTAYRNGCTLSNYEHITCGVNYASLLFEESVAVDSRDHEIYAALAMTLPKLSVALGKQSVLAVDAAQRKTLTPRLALATVIELAVLSDNESDMGERAAEQLHQLLGKPAAAEDSEWSLSETFHALHDLCERKRREGKSMSARLVWWVEFFAQHESFETTLRELDMRRSNPDDLKSFLDSQERFKVCLLQMSDHMNPEKSELTPLTVRMSFQTQQLSFEYMDASLDKLRATISDLSFGTGSDPRLLTFALSAGSGVSKQYAVMCTTPRERNCLSAIFATVKTSMAQAAVYTTKGGDAAALATVRNKGKTGGTGVQVDVNIVQDDDNWVATCAGVKEPLVLGEGGFGKVFLATNRTTATVVATKLLNGGAIKRCKEQAFNRKGDLNQGMGFIDDAMTGERKEVDPNETDEQFAERQENAKDMAYFEEMMRLVMLQHKHIVKYLGMDQGKRDAYIAIHMEYMGGGSIKTVLEITQRPADPTTVRHWLRQILNGLHYLHSNSILHHDIKCDNVLLSQDHQCAKICDFGESIFGEASLIKNQSQNVNGWTAPFCSPEVWTGAAFDEKADVWALGCAVIEMVCGYEALGIEAAWTSKRMKQRRREEEGKKSSRVKKFPLKSSARIHGPTSN